MASVRKKPTTRLEVVELTTGAVVHTVSVAGKSEPQIEKALMGMLRNMDTERFAVREAP